MDDAFCSINIVSKYSKCRNDPLTGAGVFERIAHCCSLLSNISFLSIEEAFLQSNTSQPPDM